MDLVIGALNFLIFYILIKNILKLFLKSKGAVKDKEADGLEVELTKVQEDVEQKEVIEMVVDQVCGCAVPKAKAYIIANNNTEYYFCSWECREKFLNR